MSQNHKLIAIDGSRMRTLCKNARGGSSTLKMKLHLKIFLFLISFLVGCTRTESEVAGTYVKEPSIHTIDSLFLFSDTIEKRTLGPYKLYKFKQRYYNKETNVLLFENTGNWYLKNNVVNIQSLYLDMFGDENPLGRSYTKSYLKNSIMPCSLPIEGKTIKVNDDYQVQYIKK